MHLVCLCMCVSVCVEVEVIGQLESPEGVDFLCLMGGVERVRSQISRLGCKINPLPTEPSFC